MCPAGRLRKRINISLFLRFTRLTRESTPNRDPQHHRTIPYSTHTCIIPPALQDPVGPYTCISASKRTTIILVVRVWGNYGCPPRTTRRRAQFAARVGLRGRFCWYLGERGSATEAGRQRYHAQPAPHPTHATPHPCHTPRKSL